MFFLAPLIGMAASALGGAVGEAFKGAGRAKQEELLRAAMDEFGNIDPAKFEEIVAQELGPSAMAGVKTDPRLTGEQYEGLDAYDEIVNNGGMDPVARADLNRASTAAARTAGGNINRIQQDLDARGMGTSGAGVLLRAQAAQDANQNMYDNSLNAASTAWQRRIQALGAKTGLAGNMRQQEFGEKSRRAEAEDSIARYNADARTAAARYRNQQKQQSWENQFRTAQAKANALTGQGQAAKQSADEQGNYIAGTGAAAGGAVNDAYAASRQDERDARMAEEREKDRQAGYRPYYGSY